MTYAAVDRTIWTQPAVRQLTPRARLLLLYFLSSDRGNMIGVFVCPPAFVTYYTGIPEAEVLIALQGSLNPFLDYDPDTEEVFVFDAARLQVGENLKPTDNRRKKVQNQVRDVISDGLRVRFLEVYSAWKLSEPEEGAPKGLPDEPKGASEGDHTETDTEAEAETGLASDARRVFEYWKEKRRGVLALNGGAPVQFTEKRKRKVLARLKSGWTEDDLKGAIDGCLSNDFNVLGGHTDLELICRDETKTRRYYDLSKNEEKNNDDGAATPAEIDAMFNGAPS